MKYYTHHIRLCPDEVETFVPATGFPGLCLEFGEGTLQVQINLTLQQVTQLAKIFSEHEANVKETAANIRSRWK